MLVAVVAIRNFGAVLYLEVDETTRIVTSWRCVNTLPDTVLVRLTNGDHSFGQAVPSGQTTDSAIQPAARQWSIDSDAPVTYELSTVR